MGNAAAIYNDLLIRVKTEVDNSGKEALKQINKEAKAAADATGKAANETSKLGNASRKSGYMVQNASYQIADFFVMLQGGINPVRALSTQLPQLLAGFGAFGAAAGAVAAIGASVFVAFQNGSDSAESYAKSLAKVNEALNNLGQKSGSQAEALARALEGADEETAALAQALYRLGQVQASIGLEKQTEAFKEYVKALKEASASDLILGGLQDFANQGGQNLNQSVVDPIRNIKKEFGLTSDAVAQDVLNIISAFQNGEQSAISLATAFADLYSSGTIQGNSGLAEFVEQIDKLVLSKKEVEAFKGVLEKIGVDAEIKGLEQLEKFKNLADPSREAIKGLKNELIDLNAAMSVEGGLNVEQFEKAYKSLLDTYLKPGKITTEEGLNAALAALKEAADQGVISLEEVDRRYNALIDSLLQPVELPVNERLLALQKQGQALLDQIDPSSAALRRYKEALFGAESALASLGLEGNELAKALQAIRDKMAGDFINAFYPAEQAIENYQATVTALREELSSLGLTADEVEQKVRQFSDSLLQPIVVTARKKPNWKEAIDYEGLIGIQQDIKNSFDEWGNSLGDSIVDALDKGMESFKEFADFIIKQIARIAIQNLIIQPLVNSLGSLFPAPSSIGIGEVEQTNPINDNARVQAVSAAPMMGYIAAPSLTGKTSTTSPVTVNVNNYGNDDVEVEQRKTSRGLEIDVLIKGAVKKGIAQGDFDNVMRSSFGTRRLAY